MRRRRVRSGRIGGSVEGRVVNMVVSMEYVGRANGGRRKCGRRYPAVSGAAKALSSGPCHRLRRPLRSDGSEPFGQPRRVLLDESQQRRAAAALPGQTEEVEVWHDADAAVMEHPTVLHGAGYVDPRVVRPV